MPNIKVVLGALYGDCGKGRIVDYLCSKGHTDFVVRFSGGPQAAHRVVVDNKEHIFSHFGSGALRKVPTLWLKYCTVDPSNFMNEFNILYDKNGNAFLYVDLKCPVTTPYDKAYNKSHNIKKKSCGIGFGATLQREQDFFSLTVKDLNNEWVLREKLNNISEYYLTLDPNINVTYECIENFINACNMFIKYVIPINFNNTSIFNNCNMIFEGSQGLMLDQNQGFFPYVTRSNTDLTNILDFYKNKMNFSFSPKIYLVTRAYQTRHGTGPLSHEDVKINILHDPDEKNVNNINQGKFRRSILDVDLLKYSTEQISNHYKTTLAITCLDHIREDRKFIAGGQIFEFSNDEDFCKAVANHLNISNVLMCDKESIKKLTFVGDG